MIIDNSVKCVLVMGEENNLDSICQQSTDFVTQEYTCRASRCFQNSRGL